MSWRMDKNKFWLGGRLFNTASPRLGAPTQCKARLEDGRLNATQGTSASWVPQRNKAHPVGHVHKCKQGTSARPQVGRHNATQGTSTRWSPKRNRRHVCKLGAPMQRKARLQVGRPNARPQRKCNARPQVGRPNATQGTSARWSAKRKTHP
jgi:hypothetical protein